MKKKKNSNKRSVKTNKKCVVVQSPLDLHNISSYIEDNAIISRFSKLPLSKQDWIETNRYKLQYSAPKAEHVVGTVLINRSVKFIHQAPFVISGKIYFADFFVPSLRTIIEIDGFSHNNMIAEESDKSRDRDFFCIGIKTIRISNHEAMSEKYLLTRLAAEGIIR